MYQKKLKRKREKMTWGGALYGREILCEIQKEMLRIRGWNVWEIFHFFALSYMWGKISDRRLKKVINDDPLIYAEVENLTENFLLKLMKIETERWERIWQTRKVIKNYIVANLFNFSHA